MLQTIMRQSAQKGGGYVPLYAQRPGEVVDAFGRRRVPDGEQAIVLAAFAAAPSRTSEDEQIPDGSDGMDPDEFVGIEFWGS